MNLKQGILEIINNEAGLCDECARQSGDDYKSAFKMKFNTKLGTFVCKHGHEESIDTNSREHDITTYDIIYTRILKLLRKPNK
jgi:hypothetical protein